MVSGFEAPSVVMFFSRLLSRLGPKVLFDREIIKRKDLEHKIHQKEEDIKVSGDIHGLRRARG